MANKENKEQDNPVHADDLQQDENLTDDVQELNQIEQLTADLQASNDKFLRLYAEFDNFKRRTAKEKIESMQSAGKEVITNLLPVYDDFERAFVAMEDATDVPAVREGVELIFQKFQNILSQQGLKAMETVGLPFDADFHEAVAEIPAQDDSQKGIVLDEIQKGYFLNDRIIRFAKVVTGK